MSVEQWSLALEKPKPPIARLDAETISRGTADRLTARLTSAIGTRFDRSGIAFDSGAFRARLSKAVERVIMNPAIPEIAKDKFIADVMKRQELLASVSLEDINSLRERRKWESAFVEPLELELKYGNDEPKKQAYFLDKILSETIMKYIEPAAHSLEQAYAPKISVSGHEYTTPLLTSMFASLDSLDAQYALRTATSVRAIASDRTRLASGDLKREGLFRELAPQIVAEFSARRKIPQERFVLDLVKNGNLTERSRLWVGTQAVLPDGKTVDIVDVLLSYRKTFATFQGSESEVEDVRGRATDTGLFSQARERLDIDSLESEFRHLDAQNVEEKIKQASFADMVIMATQLAQLAPLVGDIGGGFDGLISAYSGMNVQGAKLTVLERTLDTVFGVLGITIIWGMVANSARVGRLAKLVRMIEPLGKYFPEKLQEFVAAGGHIPEQARQLFETFVHMMGGQTELAYARVAEDVSDLSLSRTKWRSGGWRPKIKESSKIQSIEDLLGGTINLHDKTFIATINGLLPDRLRISEAHIREFDSYNKALVDMGREGQCMSPADFIRWVTGNYNPQTGKIRLFRYVNADAIEPLVNHGWVISRAVDHFGSGDLHRAIENMQQLAQGVVNSEMRVLHQRFLREIEVELWSGVSGPRGRRLQNSHDLYVQVIRWIVPDELRIWFREWVELLTKKAHHTDFSEDVIRTSNGATPAQHERLVAYSPIHWTTSEAPFWDLVNNRKFKIICEADQREAYPTGMMHHGKWTGRLDNEQEWTSFGAVYPKDGNKMWVENLETWERFEVTGPIKGRLGGVSDIHAFGVADHLADTKTLRIRSVVGSSAQEIERNIIEMIRKTDARHIEMASDMSLEMRRTISNLLAKNHPLLEIIRLTPGQDVVNVNYGGTKAFNAIFGPQAYDEFLATFKSIMHERLPDHIRVPRDDYKNTSISVDEGLELIAAVFGGLSPAERVKFLDEVIAKHGEKIVVLAKSKGMSIAECEKKFRDTFSFQFGVARVEQGAGPLQAMETFYEAEMRSRGIIPKEWQKFEQAHKEIAERIFSIEREFVHRYHAHAFPHDGKMIPMIITLPGGQKRLHPDLIQLVRKGEEWIVDPDVFSAVQKWIGAINGFDFIPPFVDFEKDIANARRIDEGLRTWTFHVDDLLRNYKGTHTVAAYELLSEGKKGAHIFIDIVGMGLMNFDAFRALAVKYLSGSATAMELLNAGGSVTKRFVDLVSHIREKYPTAIVSLGGDEVRIFIPGMTESGMAQVLSDITKGMGKTNLKGRVSHAVNPTGSVKDTLYEIDSITSVNKAIEGLLHDYRVTYVDLHGVEKSDAIAAIKSPEARDFLKRLRGEPATVDLVTPWWMQLHLWATPGEDGLYRFDFSHI